MFLVCPTLCSVLGRLDRRLEKIRRARFRSRPYRAAIGAGPILVLLKQFQAEYGAIIGTTQPVEEAPEIRDSKAALLDSIRSYVIQVAASVKRGAPDTATRADLLLKPVREWESTKAAKESTPPATPV